MSLSRPFKLRCVVFQSFMPVTFCQSCNNCMYPIEDVNGKFLEYVCRREGCSRRMRTASSLIESNAVMQKWKGASLAALSPHVNDSALKCIKLMTCPSCRRGDEVKLLMNPYHNDQNDMGLICICTTCAHVWKRSEDLSQST